jgi:hypothetical protein
MNNLQIARWSEAAAKAKGAPHFVFDKGDVTDDLADCYVVTPKADRTRIEALLAAGVCQVLIGEVALFDNNLVSDVVKQYGGERIGIWLPVRRASANWSLDRESNADFSFISISTPLARWMALRNDGCLTDVDALWWAGEMLKAGCSSVMVSVDDPQDDDLLACAEMSEIAADHFWLDTGSADVEELRFWVKYGHVQQLIVPAESDIDELLVDLNKRLIQESAVG